MPRVSAVGGEGYSGRVRGLAVTVALFALLAAGCGSESGDQAAPTTTETAQPEGGPMAPAIEGTTLDGERLSLADFRGRPVLVNVWAAW
jgi:cytochrome oxidase Cu insertion factor (SCO1/SenC/PrrC family)